MELTPEIKAQLAEQKKQCIFCKIISKEQESQIVFEDDTMMGVLDIYPAVKGHSVFFLKEHYPIMPYIPADEFKHFFGLVPKLSEAVQSGMVARGMNVFIANGGVAGQQASHFLIHYLPRDPGDNFFNFDFSMKQSLDSEKISMLKNNLPIMMKNHFGRNPAEWHTGEGNPIDTNGVVIYEDEKVVCVLPEKGTVAGHLEILSKLEDQDITKLSNEDSSHLFYVASFAATALFEGLKVHGTNIILKSGQPDNKLAIHVLPRLPDDGLQKMLWEPKQPSYDLSSIASKIKDQMWKVSQKVKKVIAPMKTPEVIKIGGSNHEDEIRKAILSRHS